LDLHGVFSIYSFIADVARMQRNPRYARFSPPLQGEGGVGMGCQRADIKPIPIQTFPLKGMA
jgi:hypothetical protein